MKIGILTFYRVQNFGANLQAISTYFALKKRGHDPVFIYYESEAMSKAFGKDSVDCPQKQEHFNLVDNLLPKTELCRNANDVSRIIDKEGIEAVIAGSDAVLQHHPLLSRLRRGRIRPFYVLPTTPDRTFPNPFWGEGVSDKVPMAIMSASCQNSAYNMFSGRTKKRMSEALSKLKYISVRDTWTQEMVRFVSNGKEVPITPDPVFAFNINAPELIPSKEEIRQKFSLPERYVLISLDRQSLSSSQLAELKNIFADKGYHCVAFPMPNGVRFKHNFDYEINTPLPPLDWYSIISNSSGYIGSNMHPIVVSLHNAVPCYSIDNWGSRNFWGKTKNDGSSKVLDIMKFFRAEGNHSFIESGQCDINSNELVVRVLDFPKDLVANRARILIESYNRMMDNICEQLTLYKTT